MIRFKQKALQYRGGSEATAHFITRRYQAFDVKISRISRGVPEGGELEYMDEFILNRVLDQRVVWEKAR